MANRLAPALLLGEGGREALEQLTRSWSVWAGLAQRARIVLLAADGVSNTAIAQRVGVSRPTVIAWRDRYQAKGIGGLADEDRSGRPRQIDRSAVIAATLTLPKTLGITHWSTRLLARHLKISDHSVATIWREQASSPGGPSRFGSPPTRSWKPRLSTWSGSTSTLPRTRSCSRSTRRARSRPWIGPRRCCPPSRT